MIVQCFGMFPKLAMFSLKNLLAFSHILCVVLAFRVPKKSDAGSGRTLHDSWETSERARTHAQRNVPGSFHMACAQPSGPGTLGDTAIAGTEFSWSRSNPTNRGTPTRLRRLRSIPPVTDFAVLRRIRYSRAVERFGSGIWA